MEQMFEELNRELNQPTFSAEAFTLLLELGGCFFTRFSGSTAMRYRKGTATRPTMLKMSLAANEGGYNRLKVYYISDRVARMKFYTQETLASGVRYESNVEVVENVEYAYLLDVFERVTGLYTRWGGTQTPDTDTPAPDPDYY